MSGGGGVILLVDDSPMEQSVIRSTLARDRYDIHVASDGHMAVEKAKALRPDLIILDYLLPEVDGLSVLKDIRAMGLDAVVIMLTGHGSEQVAAAALLYRADYYLIKPVVPWQLRDLVRVSLRYRKTAQDLHHLTELHLKVLDNLPVGVFILDREGNVRGWNRAMERLTDIPENRVLGRSAFENCPFLMQIQESGVLAKLSETGETQIIEELPALNISGKPITLAVRLAFLHSGEAIVGVLEDITPRVRAREQLLQAERMAFATKMVVTTSHEINNPLTVILGNIQFLKEDLGSALNEQSQEDIKLIEQSALRVQEFIRRMANVSSATTAPYVGGLEMFDLSPKPKTTE
jgi:PAS domain S-box-containing protein